MAWRLPRRQLQCRPPWLEGGCSLANLPSKNTLTTTQQRLSTRRDLNGQQRLPWCPICGAAAYNSQPACWMIVVCGGAGSRAPWRPWYDGGRHGRWGLVWLALASFYLTTLTKSHITTKLISSIPPHLNQRIGKTKAPLAKRSKVSAS